MQQTQLTSYHVWDRGIRWFHWINVLSVLTLLGTGLVIFNVTVQSGPPLTHPESAESFFLVRLSGSARIGVDLFNR